MENYNHEWSDLLPPKRSTYPPMVIGTVAPPHIYTGHPTQFLDFQSGSHMTADNIRGEPRDGLRGDDRDVRSLSTDPYRPRVGGERSGNSGANERPPATSSGEEEWKNIHTMLSCVSAMVEKTKRAITILQQRSSDTPVNYTADTALAEMKRQTEEKVADFRRNAEEAVNQVKRQAVIEIQRAVATAESRAVEIMAQERLKMDKFFSGKIVKLRFFSLCPQT